MLPIEFKGRMKDLLGGESELLFDEIENGVAVRSFRINEIKLSVENCENALADMNATPARFPEGAFYTTEVYVLLDGIYGGFGTWWLPYLYIWAILWAITMLLPRKMPGVVAAVVYPVVCGLFGIFFGTLYAPVWAIVAGFNLEQTIAWIISGLSFDILHAVGNAAIGCLVLPLSKVLLKLENSTHR